MKPAPLPPDEEARLERLRSYGILDTIDEKEYDDIVRLVAQICNTPMANISLVDRHRQWFKAAVGLKDRETSRDIAFCGYSILGTELFTVTDASQDERFADNPLVREDPNIRFYAGMPLVTPDGYSLGALCAIDSVPRELTDEQKEALRILARHVIDLLELRLKNRELEELSHHKSRLLALLAHDVRAPVANFKSLLGILMRSDTGEEERKGLYQELEKSIDATDLLIENIGAWVRRTIGRDDGESGVRSVDLAALARELSELISPELQAKGNSLNLAVEASLSLITDRGVLYFSLRNLLLNANKFTKNGTITLSAVETSDGIEISVTDTGVGIPPNRLESLFNWEARHSTRGTAGERGSGLALLLIKELLAFVGGEISVQSSVGEGSTFSIRLPAMAAPG